MLLKLPCRQPILRRKTPTGPDGILSPVVLYLPHLFGEGEWKMLIAICLVMAVDTLLLLATAKLRSVRLHPLRLAAAVALDALSVLLGSAPGIPLAKDFALRVLALLLTGVTAFGISYGVLIFALLNLSLGGIADSSNQILPPLMGAAGLGLACMVLGKDNRYVPVELIYHDKKLRFTALRDTGNNLRDPITGKFVLIVDADIAFRLTGLTHAELSNPVSNLDRLPGLRLIPYQTVGNHGFLLALTVSQAKIGNRQSSVVVAFSPQILGSKYQALTGGSV